MSQRNNNITKIEGKTLRVEATEQLTSLVPDRSSSGRVVAPIREKEGDVDAPRAR